MGGETENIQKKTRAPKQKPAKQRGEKGGSHRRSHQQHTKTARSARTGERGQRDHGHLARNTKGAHTGEHAPSGPGHRTRAGTKGGRGAGPSEPHPQGRTHWGHPADPPGQWQERYSKATGPSPASLRQGQWETSTGAMATTDDRRAGPGRGRLPSSGAPQLKPQG